MCLYYETQNPVILVGTKTAAGVRTGVALTSAYQSESGSTPTKTIETAGFSKANFDVNYTMGSGETSNSIEARVDASPDGINFYSIANESATAGTSTLTAREFTFVGANAAAATISIFIDIAYKYVRVAFKETGVVTNAGNVFCEVTLSGK